MLLSWETTCELNNLGFNLYWRRAGGWAGSAAECNVDPFPGAGQ